MQKVAQQQKIVAQHINPKKIKSKLIVDRFVRGGLLGITILCSSIIVMIVIFIFIKGISPFINDYMVDSDFYRVDFWKFITGRIWFISPNLYGIGFVIINTLYIVLLAILIAVPISVLTALFITKMAPKRLGDAMSYIVELLASIPSIVYGVFGAGVITVMVRDISTSVGYQSAGGISTLSTVLVLAIMIMPTITMLSMASIRAVRNDIIHGSLALGASKVQTNFKVVLTSAKSGIFSGIILGVGRGLGEATAISMVIGNAGSGPTFNFFDMSRTLTSTMLLGLKETSGLDYDIRFSVGIVLMVVIILTNVILNLVKKRIGKIV